MPKAIKKKAKKKAHSEPDVQEKLLDMKAIFEQKQKKVALYGVALLALALIVGGFFIHIYRADQKAKELEYEGYKVFYGEYVKQPLPEKERFRKALDLFKQSYETRKKPRVLLYIANSYYKLAEYDKALSTFSDFVKDYSDNRNLLPLAYKEMADIQLKKGNKEEALKVLSKLYNTPGGIFRDYALMESGRILEEEGKKKDAMAKYKELTAEFKDSPFYGEAESKLGGNKKSSPLKLKKQVK